MRHIKLIFQVALVLALLALAIALALDRPRPATSTSRPPIAASTPTPSPATPDAPDAPVTWPATAPRLVLGLVEDPEGAPIAGAQIIVTRDAAQPRRAESDHEGRFRLERLAPGFQGARVTALGYSPLNLDAQALPFPAQSKVTWRFTLEPAPMARGIVRTQDGAVVEGAWVFLRAEGRRFPEVADRANRLGRFALPWPKDRAALSLVARHGQHGEISEEIFGPGEYTLTLPGGGFVSGQVVDEDNQPISQFSVTASPLLSGAGGASAQAFDDPDGRFRLGPLAAGSARLWAAAEGYQPVDSPALDVQAGAEVEGVVLRLRRSIVLIGRVLDAQTGRPIEGASLTPAEWRAQVLAETAAVYTDAQGRYRLSTLPGARSSLYVEAEGYRRLLVGGVEGRPGATVNRDLRLTALAEGERQGTGELTGIGAVLRAHPQGVLIDQLVEGGPASEVLAPGDVVVGVGARPGGLDVRRAAQAIRGEPGSEVRLWVKRGGQGAPTSLILRRARVEMPRRRPVRPPHGHL
ncbi:carboxypeptidase regulatory-like domain-containing protein [Myxococcota bacterium]|nr:carboxypeptidase regulatory-like domain-containing protein [Myxococcota bacterium]MBU1432611.1 carboxypeptidase regulatory-like domain-containing protein [Myxococcota bacterium]MBU1899526.1 carboxypeptidase regulatory-like domain-containing protein [Myxococcota bacterium]